MEKGLHTNVIKEIDQINEEIYDKRNASDIDIKALINSILENSRKARAIDYYDGFAESLRVLGTLYCYAGESVKAVETLEQAEYICMNFDVNQEVLANLYNAFLYYYSEVMNNYKKAAEYAKKGLDLAKKLNMPHLVAKLTINYGVISLDVGLYEESLESFQTSLEFGEIAGDDLIVAYSHVNMADTYFKLKEYELARKHYLLAEDVNREFKDIMIMVDIMRGISLIEKELGNLDSACSYLESAIEKLKNNGLVSYQIELSQMLLENYIVQNNYENAENLINEIEPIIFEAGSNALKSKFHKSAAEFYAKIGNYEEAYKNEKTYNEYQEKVMEEREFKAISQVREESNRGKLEQLQMLSEIGKEINALHSIEEIFDSIYSHMKDYYKKYNLLLGLVEDDFVNYVYVNGEGEKIAPYKLERNNKKYLASWALDNDSFVVINDVEKEYELYVEDYILYGDNNSPQSILILPLKVHDETLGVINFQTFEKNSFSIDDVEMFSIIASYAAIAVKNTLQARELRDLSIKDQLTGLYNWRFYNKKLNETIQNDGAENHISLIIMDIDHFKVVNDRYGHSSGNECLIALAELAENHFSKASFVARIGGEEFAVLMIGTSEEEVLETTNQFLDKVRELEVHSNGDSIKFTISIGASLKKREEIESEEHIFREADNALYKAKSQGRDQVVIA